ncbi:transposase [Parelusimicrobium proximum]|uniref:transposase n=1 Tax=Parelusimicrobium proximum TaxID=3228953 RepID=UPI003D17547D
MKEFDYSSPYFYFITICTDRREKIFGNVAAAKSATACPEMRLNSIGDMVKNDYLSLPLIFPRVKLHEYIFMPNHMHGIIQILDNDVLPDQTGICRGGFYTRPSECEEKGRAGIKPAPTLSDIVKYFKGITAYKYLKTHNKKLWQRGFYERVIRSEKEMAEIWEYVVYNASKWEDDEYYSA